jgi:uncharacterized protein with NRDE domain
MCIGLVVLSSDPAAPLLVLSNRDEFYERPTSALAQVTFDPPSGAEGGQGVAVFCGRDQERGGTWLGVVPDVAPGSLQGERGTRFGFLTNYREPQPASSNGAPSRGDAILGWLQSDASPEAFLASLDLSAHNGLNLVIGWAAPGGPPRVYVTSNRGTSTADPARFEPCATCCPKGATYTVRFCVSPGQGVSAFAVSNGPLGAPWPKVLRLEALAALLEPEVFSHGDEKLFAAMRDAVGWPAEEPLPACLEATGVGAALERALSAVFIEPVAFGGQVYGTRCTTLLRIGPEGRTVHMWERTFRPEDDGEPPPNRSQEAAEGGETVGAPGLRVSESVLNSNAPM